MSEQSVGENEQSREDLRWGDPLLVPAHYGQHDPVSVREEVRCAMCGAPAPNGDPDQWPDAEDDRWEDLQRQRTDAISEEADRIEFADEQVVPVLDEDVQAVVRHDEYGSVDVGDTLFATTSGGSPFAEVNVRRTASVLAVEVHGLLKLFGAAYPSEKPQDPIDDLNDSIETGVLVFEVVRHV